MQSTCSGCLGISCLNAKEQEQLKKKSEDDLNFLFDEDCGDSSDDSDSDLYTDDHKQNFVKFDNYAFVFL